MNQTRCRECKQSITEYDDWLCAWRAACCLLGTAKVISGYTEDEETAPDWDEDLGQENSYCAHNTADVGKGD